MVALCWEQGAPAPCRPWREMGEGKFSPAVPRNRPNYEGREAFVPRLRRQNVPGVRSSPEFNGGRVAGSKGLPPLANSGGKRKEGKSSFAVLGDSPNYEGREAFVPRLRRLDVPGGVIFRSLMVDALLGARGSRPLQTVEGNGGRKIPSRYSEKPSKLRRPGGLRSQTR